MEIKYYHKVKHQAHQFLVISFILFFMSCSILKQDLEYTQKVIIEKELISQSTYIESLQVVAYLDFNLNDSFIAFFEENKYDSKRKVYPKYDSLFRWLSKDEIQMIFNESEVAYLINQLKNNRINLKKITLPNNLILNNTQKEKEDIKGDGLKSVNYNTRKRFFLSNPVFLKNGNYALIQYATKSIGGIHIYKKIAGNWILYENINSWIS